jgi:hypothetical protein
MTGVAEWPIARDAELSAEQIVPLLEWVILTRTAGNCQRRA